MQYKETIAVMRNDVSVKASLFNRKGKMKGHLNEKEVDIQIQRILRENCALLSYRHALLNVTL